MDLASSQAFFWLCFGVAIFAVAVFICWVLFELARLLRQSNEVVEHTRDIVGGIEEDISNLRDKFGGILGTAAGLAKNAGTIGALFNRGSKSHSHKRHNKLTDEDEETEE
ncbi:MAG: hypothetical protein WCW31_01365 [Patescibacteria group bacterium]|jgi:hypothetical protein